MTTKPFLQAYVDYNLQICQNFFYLKMSKNQRVLNAVVSYSKKSITGSENKSGPLVDP